MKDDWDETDSKDRINEASDEPESQTQNNKAINEPETEKKTGENEGHFHGFDDKESEGDEEEGVISYDEISKEEPDEDMIGVSNPSEYSFGLEPAEKGDITTAEYSDDDGEENTDYSESDQDTNKKPRRFHVPDASGETFKAAISGMLSFFTIRKKDVGQVEIDAMENNFHLAPVVGALFFLILTMEMLLLFILNYYFSFPLGPIIAVVVLSTVMLGSKFLHFDGLVDFGDGYVASGDQEKHVTAMKDSNVGAGGLGLALIVTLATFAIYSITGGWDSQFFYAMFFIIPATEILVKNAMVSAAATGTPGNGMASEQVRKADSDTMFKSTGISALLLVLGLIMTTAIIWIINEVHMTYWSGPLIGNLSFYLTSMFIAAAVGLIMSIVVGIMMSKSADRTFGSTSGDILGATNEIARPVIAITMIFFFLIFMWVLV